MKEEADLPNGAEIDRRLRIVSELRNLCLSLGRVRFRTADQPVGEHTQSECLDFGNRLSTAGALGENAGQLSDLRDPASV